MSELKDEAELKTRLEELGARIDPEFKRFHKQDVSCSRGRDAVTDLKLQNVWQTAVSLNGSKPIGKSPLISRS